MSSWNEASSLQHDLTSPIPLEATNDDDSRRGRWGLSLFWRTFFLLALLLFGSILAWLQTLRALELEPRAIQTAQQIASLVNLSRAALVHSDAIARVSLIKTMTDQEGVRIVPREPTDTYEPFATDSLSEEVAHELAVRLGPDTTVTNRVNTDEGLGVGFTIDGDGYWMRVDRARFDPTISANWTLWLLAAVALSLMGAALIAGLINRPLKQLSFAASRVRDGDFDASRLDETVSTSEVRAVNVGFNRMTQKLAKIEHDRALMLAGISHDLRTPLARLRLETELSVKDVEARDHMAADIEQLDAIINKFLDYVRPGNVALSAVSLRDVVETCIYSVKGRTDMQFNLDLSPDLIVMADPVELGRVISNLLENARRYGKTVHTGIAQVDINAKAQEGWVLMRVRDHGPGVSPEQLADLTTPFYRGEAARTEANGTGLGLAIVENVLGRMGGAFLLSNASTGGLAANLKLRRAPLP
ncbi:MAG: ATP-binding protein [Rhodoferax sp.]